MQGYNWVKGAVVAMLSVRILVGLILFLLRVSLVSRLPWQLMIIRNNALESNIVTKLFSCCGLINSLDASMLKPLVNSSRKTKTRASRPPVCTKIKQLHFTRGFVFIASPHFVVNLIQLFNNLRAFLCQIFHVEQASLSEPEVFGMVVARQRY